MAARGLALHPMHTARGSYTVQHDYQGQYAALPQLANPSPHPHSTGLSPAAALVDSWRQQHAVVGDTLPPQDPDQDSYYRTRRKSSRPPAAAAAATATDGRTSRLPSSSSPVAGAASSLVEQPHYVSTRGQHHYVPESSARSPSDLPYSSSSSHNHHPPPPPSSQRIQHHPTHAYHQASRYSAPTSSTAQPASNRPHQSPALASTAASNRTAGRQNRHPPQQPRERDRDRDHPSGRPSHRAPYDADYDRQLSSTATAAGGGGVSSPRGLFDPRATAASPSLSSLTAPASAAVSKRHTAAGSASSPRRSQAGEGRSPRNRHGSSTASTVHSPLPATDSGAGPRSAPPQNPRSGAKQRNGPGGGGGSAERDSPGPRPASRSDDRRPARSKREPVHLADLGRRAGTVPTTTTVGGVSASRLEYAGGQGHRPGGDAKDSRESLESLGTDFSGRTKSSGPSGGRRRRRAADGGGGDDEVGGFDSAAAAGGVPGGGASTATGGGGGNKNRQLFDPRKDDPMRFAVAGAPRSGSVASASHKAAPVHPSGLTGSTVTLQTESVLNFATTEGESPYHGSGNGGDSSGPGTGEAFGASGHHGALPPPASSSSSSKRPDHPILAELKRAYREILELEKKLQDENRTATRDAERAADKFAAGGSGGGVGGGSGGVKIQGQRQKYDDDYWVKLAKAHKQ